MTIIFYVGIVGVKNAVRMYLIYDLSYQVTWY